MAKAQTPAASVCPRPPIDRPDFTVATLRKAVPAHCFERSLSRSLVHLATDLAMALCLAALALMIDHPLVPTPLRVLLWPTYWFWQGAVCTGLWVLAHECGHGAFSPSTAVNDAIGCVVHSLLLVPYWSWKHSHRRHHQNTGSTTRDEVFVPKITELGKGEAPFWQQNPVYRLAALAFILTLGWPLYLTTNLSGREYGRWASHFDPYSPIYTKKERAEIVASDIALAVVVTGLGYLSKAVGWVWLLKMYGIPLLVVNAWLVMITYLQHSHPNLPHYDDSEWEWLRGALATVDRNYGILNHFHHHIADTHVCHHLFSQIPFYHAQEATEHLRKVLGKYYCKDDRNVFVALYTDNIKCHTVSADKEGPKGVLWYH